MFWLGVVAASVFAGGYGDAASGYPSYAERELHIWTDAARVDPEAFESDYQAAGCSFYVDFTEEETTPKHPLNYNFDLNEAGRFHSDDMFENNWFDHDSSDGTSFSERLARYYSSGSVGENIAYGYSSPYSTVMQGWMCSAGHRANIMSSMWDELGTGVVSSYYTQDFGSRNVRLQNIAMGVHSPESPNSTATFYASFYDDSGFAPEVISVVLNGSAHHLSLLYGEVSQGIYSADVDIDVNADGAGSGCHEYYIEALVTAGTYRFPETGSYGWGDCSYSDDGANWLNRQLGVGDGGTTTLTEEELLGSFKLIGCSSSSLPTGTSFIWMTVGLLVVRRRSLLS